MPTVNANYSLTEYRCLNYCTLQIHTTTGADIQDTYIIYIYTHAYMYTAYTCTRLVSLMISSEYHYVLLMNDILYRLDKNLRWTPLNPRTPQTTRSTYLGCQCPSSDVVVLVIVIIIDILFHSSHHSHRYHHEVTVNCPHVHPFHLDQQAVVAE